MSQSRGLRESVRFRPATAAGKPGGQCRSGRADHAGAGPSVASGADGCTCEPGSSCGGASAGRSLAARRRRRQGRRADLPTAGRVMDRQCIGMETRRCAASGRAEGRDLRCAVGHRAHRRRPRHALGRAERRDDLEDQLPDAARQGRAVPGGVPYRDHPGAADDGARQPRGVAGGVTDREAARAGRPQRRAARDRRLRTRAVGPDRRQAGDQKHVGRPLRARDQYAGDDCADAFRQHLVPACL